jgi:hypothetical protein
MLAPFIEELSTARSYSQNKKMFNSHVSEHAKNVLIDSVPHHVCNATMVAPPSTVSMGAEVLTPKKHSSMIVIWH